MVAEKFIPHITRCFTQIYQTTSLSSSKQQSNPNDTNTERTLTSEDNNSLDPRIKAIEILDTLYEKKNADNPTTNPLLNTSLLLDQLEEEERKMKEEKLQREQQEQQDLEEEGQTTQQQEQILGSTTNDTNNDTTSTSTTDISSPNLTARNLATSPLLSTPNDNSHQVVGIAVPTIPESTESIQEQQQQEGVRESTTPSSPSPVSNP